MKQMLVATQVHPHDVRDAGADVVVRRLIDAGVQLAAAEAVTLDERHPYPLGELPHNPRHRVVVTRAALAVPLAEQTFAGAAFRPLPVLDSSDYIADLKAAGEARGLQVIPWIKGLNGGFDDTACPYLVRTVDEEPVEGWLCPCHPETADYVTRLVIGLVRRYGAPALLLDRMRYPDWSGAVVRPEHMLTCFCGTCRGAMAGEGIDVARLEIDLRTVVSALRAGDQVGPLAAHDTVRAWLRFRQRRITHLVGYVRASLRAAGLGDVAFWLNLWPPAFASLLGQHYESLASLADGAKHFPYHRLGGGADLAGLVRALAGNDDVSLLRRVYGGVTRMFAMAQYTDWDSFVADGLPVSYVAEETKRAVAAFGQVPIFTGVQMWHVDPVDMVAAARAARASGAAGYFFYCYGWAAKEALATIRACVTEETFPPGCGNGG